MIDNKQHRILRSQISARACLAESIENLIGDDALRWYIGQVTPDELIVEATLSSEPMAASVERVERQFFPGKCVVLSIVPTGVGCEIGGYAGDAAPVTNLLASNVDYLVTNPNALNASNFIGFDDNKVVFADGCCIDLFCKGAVNLCLPYSNRIGVVVEKSSDRHLDVIFNVINTVRAVHGIDIVDVIVTDKPMGGRCMKNESGAIVGTLDNPHVLFEACENLIRKGATAIAVTSNLQDIPLEAYARHFAGEHPNPVGGVEAVISYSITRRFQIPSAHAPLINVKQMNLRDRVVDARGAGEMASESGLACILIGLKRAPQIEAGTGSRIKDIVNVNNLLAVVAPASCLGGIPTLYAEKNRIPVIAVEENRTILDVSRSKLGLNNVIEVRNYAEATGVISALKAGISLESIYRPIATTRYARADADAQEEQIDRSQPAEILRTFAS